MTTTMPKTKILIGALSNWKYQERRERCRATWMADASSLGVDAVFLMDAPLLTGKTERSGRSGDTLHIPCICDYNSLTKLTLGFCRWALSLPPVVDQGGTVEAWDYLFKCDDDTYISIPRLLSYDLRGRDYIGAEWRPGVNYGSGGAGYFLSRRAATIVAEQLECYPTGAEDLLVGRILAAAGIPLHIEPRFIPFANLGLRPSRDNDFITSHASTEAFMASHLETGLAGLAAA